jgi:hypothetical protein
MKYLQGIRICNMIRGPNGGSVQEFLQAWVVANNGIEQFTARKIALQFANRVKQFVVILFFKIIPKGVDIRIADYQYSRCWNGINRVGNNRRLLLRVPIVASSAKQNNQYRYEYQPLFHRMGSYWKRYAIKAKLVLALNDPSILHFKFAVCHIGQLSVVSNDNKGLVELIAQVKEHLMQIFGRLTI